MRRVYFIKPIGMDGPVKIGCSHSPDGRLSTLNTWSPFALEIVAEIDGDERLERRFHGLFKEQHQRREWFAWTPELQRVIDEVRAGTFDTTTLPPPCGVTTKGGGNRKKLSPAQRLATSYRARFMHMQRRHGLVYDSSPNTCQICGEIGRGTATPEMMALADDMLANPEKYSITRDEDDARTAAWKAKYRGWLAGVFQPAET